MDALHTLIGPHDGATFLLFSVRTVIVLAFGIACVRIAGRTTFSQLSPLDIVVAIVVGSTLSRAITGSVPFLPALGSNLLLVLLHRGLAWLGVRWRPLGLLVKGRVAVIVRDGVADTAELRRHRISNDDLHEALRLGGAATLSEVRLAMLEDGGKISVIKRDK
ncbi:MAG: DUF421 domain-containing protein [Pseudomonadota bacterium]|nr:DUF421 domain-containing protein [Pseudomonadota bacterium]